MSIPYFYPAKRNVAFSLLLVLVLVLLVLTGLGVFRLYFSFDWHGGDTSPGDLFNLKIRGGNAFNVFDAEPFGEIFWSSQLVVLCMAIALPWFRLIGGAIIAVLTTAIIFFLHFQVSPAEQLIPLEFELLAILVLFLIYVLLQFVAESRDRKQFALLLSQYVPQELANAYSRDPNSMGMDGEVREVSVLFCDVVGFSSISEQLESQQVAAWLNSFFSLTSKIVVRHRGTIDKYMGDSMMAVWGAPARSDTHAFDALSAAMDIQAELVGLNAYYAKHNLPSIQVGVGVSTGMANVGPLGSEYRKDYTVVGDTVNVAQRLEGQTRYYGASVVVSDKTANALPDMLFRELDTILVKGRKQPVTMFEPLGLKVLVSDEDHQLLKLHQQALDYCKEEAWAKANTLFTQLRDEWGPAVMYEHYIHTIKDNVSALELAAIGDEYEVSVVYFDILASKAFDQLDAEQQGFCLKQLFCVVSNSLQRFGGLIDGQFSQGVVAVWGAPKRSNTHALDALSAALDIQSQWLELNARFRMDNLPEVSVGIGVGTGTVTLDSHAITDSSLHGIEGMVVDIAMRLEQQTLQYKAPVLVCESTAQALPEMLFRELDTLFLKAHQHEVTIWEPVELEETASEQTIACVEAHRLAMEASKQGDWLVAKELFIQLRFDWGPPALYERYLRGIEAASQQDLQDSEAASSELEE